MKLIVSLFVLLLTVSCSARRMELADGSKYFEASFLENSSDQYSEFSEGTFMHEKFDKNQTEGGRLVRDGIVSYVGIGAAAEAFKARQATKNLEITSEAELAQLIERNRELEAARQAALRQQQQSLLAQ